MAHRSKIRRLAWGALTAQVLFTASWVRAGALEDPGFVVLGLSLVALGVALRWVLPRRPASLAATALFVGAGAVNIAWALAPGDAEHLRLGIASSVLLVSTPYAVSRALWPSPVASAALAGANVGFWAAAAMWASLFTFEADGVARRLGFLVVTAWVVIVAVGLLHVTRRAPSPGPLVGVRPRDFLAREWSGDGELVLRPLFLGRFFAQRLQALRRTTWISDRVWRVDDEARFERGHVERREMWCEWVSDEHVRLTAGDMPDGADVWVEENGFRIAPFRFAFPLGPLPWLGRCRDRSHVLPDGTFVSVLDAYTPGLPIPIARLTFRVRPASEGRAPHVDVAATDRPGGREAAVGPDVDAVGVA